MKTSRNPRTKRDEWIAAVLRAPRTPLSASSSSVRPETKVTYVGTIGSTHGERNDTMPARKAKANEMLVASIRIEADRVPGPDSYPSFFVAASPAPADPAEADAATVDSVRVHGPGIFSAPSRITTVPATLSWIPCRFGSQ